MYSSPACGGLHRSIVPRAAASRAQPSKQTVSQPLLSPASRAQLVRAGRISHATSSVTLLRISGSSSLFGLLSPHLCGASSSLSGLGGSTRQPRLTVSLGSPSPCPTASILAVCAQQCLEECQNYSTPALHPVSSSQSLTQAQNMLRLLCPSPPSQ